MRTDYLIFGGLTLAAVMVWRSTLKSRLIAELAKFIPSVEGFRSTPYWDVSRYSWGYGTKAPGASGSISREQAFNDMVKYLLSDYEILRPKLTRALNVRQWAALLSFSYNLGNDDAADIVPYINQGDELALIAQWMRYVHSGGSVNPTLVDRREKELGLWFS